MPLSLQVKLNCTRDKWRLLIALLKNSQNTLFIGVATGPAATNYTFDFHLVPMAEPEGFGKSQDSFPGEGWAEPALLPQHGPSWGWGEAAGNAPSPGIPCWKEEAGMYQPGMCQQGEMKPKSRVRDCPGQGQRQKEQEGSLRFKKKKKNFLLKFAFVLPSN